MPRLLSTLGLVVVAGWLVLLLAREKLGHDVVPVPPHMLEVGLGIVALGLILAVVSRARGVVARSHCVRCGKPIAKGETYCSQHFRESVNEARDAERK